MQNIHSIFFPLRKPVAKVVKLSEISELYIQDITQVWQGEGLFEFDEAKSSVIGHFSTISQKGDQCYLTYLVTFSLVQLEEQKFQSKQEVLFVPIVYLMQTLKPIYHLTRQLMKGINQQFCRKNLKAQLKALKEGLVYTPEKICFVASLCFNTLNFENWPEATSLQLDGFLPKKNTLEFHNISLFEGERFSPLPSNSIQKLLELISPNYLVKLFSALLLERKIILVASDYTTLGLVIENFLNFLSPFNSEYCKVITHIKEEMIDYLGVPTPFFIGVPKEIWTNIGERAWNEVSEDTVCFDMSLQQWRFKESFGDFAPPRQIAQLLENSIQELQNFQIQDPYYSDHRLYLQAKRAFNNFIMLSLLDFQNFISQTDEIKYIERFQFEQYIQSKEEECQKFYEQFCQTNIFQDFVNEAIPIFDLISQNSPDKIQENPKKNLLLFISELHDIETENKTVKEVFEGQNDQIESYFQLLSSQKITMNFESLREQFNMEQIEEKFDRLVKFTPPLELNLKEPDPRSSQKLKRPELQNLRSSNGSSPASQRNRINSLALTPAQNQNPKNSLLFSNKLNQSSQGPEVKEMSMKLSGSQKQTLTPRDNQLVKSKFQGETGSNDTLLRSDLESNASQPATELRIANSNSISSPIEQVIKNAYQKKKQIQRADSTPINQFEATLHQNLDLVMLEISQLQTLIPQPKVQTGEIQLKKNKSNAGSPRAAPFGHQKSVGSFADKRRVKADILKYQKISHSGLSHQKSQNQSTTNSFILNSSQGSQKKGKMFKKDSQSICLPQSNVRPQNLGQTITPRSNDSSCSGSLNKGSPAPSSFQLGIPGAKQDKETYKTAQSSTSSKGIGSRGEAHFAVVTNQQNMKKKVVKQTQINLSEKPSSKKMPSRASLIPPHQQKPSMAMKVAHDSKQAKAAKHSSSAAVAVNQTGLSDTTTTSVATTVKEKKQQPKGSSFQQKRTKANSIQKAAVNANTGKRPSAVLDQIKPSQKASASNFQIKDSEEDAKVSVPQKRNQALKTVQGMKVLQTSYSQSKLAALTQAQQQVQKDLSQHESRQSLASKPSQNSGSQGLKQKKKTLIQQSNESLLTQVKKGSAKQSGPQIYEESHNLPNSAFGRNRSTSALKPNLLKNNTQSKLSSQNTNSQAKLQTIGSTQNMTSMLKGAKTNANLVSKLKSNVNLARSSILGSKSGSSHKHLVKQGSGKEKIQLEPYHFTKMQGQTQEEYKSVVNKGLAQKEEVKEVQLSHSSYSSIRNSQKYLSTQVKKKQFKAATPDKNTVQTRFQKQQPSEERKQLLKKISQPAPSDEDVESPKVQ